MDGSVTLDASINCAKGSTSLASKKNNNAPKEEFFNPLNKNFLFTCGIVMFFALILGGKDEGDALIASVLGFPFVAFIVWALGTIFYFLMRSGFEVGKSYAKDKGLSPKYQIVFGLIGVLIFVFIFA